MALKENLTPAQALNKAKIRLMSTPDSAFFTTVCFSLKHIWDDTVPTAATDGRNIRFNPEFFLSLTTDEQVFLLLHEAMHVAYLHLDRKMGRKHSKWNVAGDLVINQHLVDRGFKMPKMGLFDPQYKDMSTEEVYNRLPEDPACPMPDLMECDGEPDVLQREIEDILVRAQIQSKMENDKPGTIPGEVQIFLNGLLDPKLPWNRILQKYLFNYAKNDYTFKKFNRRYFPTFLLPGLRSEALIDLAVAVDTSGSVTDEEFKVFISEIHAILRMMKPEKITLLQFDTQLRSAESVRSVTELSQVKFSGRGGTSIGPVLQWIDENKPQLTLIFTDGCFGFYGQETQRDVIWLIHNNPQFDASFGKVIYYAI